MNTPESDRQNTPAPWNKGKVVGQKAPLPEPLEGREHPLRRLPEGVPEVASNRTQQLRDHVSFPFSFCHPKSNHSPFLLRACN